MKSRIAPIPLMLAALGCADAGGDAAPEVAVRDSAGIAIVENPLPPDSGGALALGAEPDLVIGVLEGAAEYQLYRVGRPVRLSDGRIAVPNSGSHEIRYYDADGRFLRAIGREGDGPGEFRGLSVIGRLPGDTLLVYDQRNRRLNLIDGGGAFVRAIPLEGEARFPFPVGMLDTERIVFTSNQGFERVGEGAPDGMLHDTTGVYVVPWRDGLEIGDPSFRVPANPLFIARGDDFMMMRPLLLTTSTYVGAHDGAVYWAPVDGYEIRILGADGAPARIVRRAHEPVAVTGAVWDAEVERILENTDDEGWRRRQRPMFADMPQPSHLPARGTVRVDDAGRIWVERYVVGADETTPSTWDVYDETGTWTAAVAMPAGFSPREIGEDYVLGVHRDELEVEQVRMYALERAAPLVD